MREKDELSAERDAQIAQIAALRAEIGVHIGAIRQREAERAAAGGDIQTLKEEILVSKAEQARAASHPGRDRSVGMRRTHKRPNPMRRNASCGAASDLRRRAATSAR